MNVFDDNPKNLYVIKHRLSELKKYPADSCFHYHVGDFIVKIFTHKLQESNDVYHQMAQWVVDPDKDWNRNESPDDCITKHDKVDVNLYEWQRSTSSHETRWEVIINMDVDSRFKDYQPIKHSAKYMFNETGIGMPILNLCELIKYLHRLSNLTVFY